MSNISLAPPINGAKCLINYQRSKISTPVLDCVILETTISLVSLANAQLNISRHFKYIICSSRPVLPNNLIFHRESSFISKLIAYFALALTCGIFF